MTSRLASVAAVVLAVAWVPLAGGPAGAATGDPDAAFNARVGSTFVGGDHLEQVVVQPDGKIVVGGRFGGVSRGLARFNADGSPDTAFNTNVGDVLDDQVIAVALQPDGDIVVGGRFGSGPRYLARFNSDGTADTAFNNAAKTVVGDWVYAIAVQPDGKIVVGGIFGSPSAGVARLNSDGTADTAFNANAGQSLEAHVEDVALQSDGKIVVVGGFGSPRYLARLNDDGTPDTAFNTAVGTTLNSTTYGVVVQPDGKIVVAGSFSSPSRFLARFGPDGSPDTAFNGNVGTTIGGYSAYGLARQADGKILLGGWLWDPSDQLMRFDSDGNVDAAFDAGVGSNLNALVYSVAVQTPAKVLVGGWFTTPSRFLARFDALPVPGTPTGVTATQTGNREATVSWSAPAPNGVPVGKYVVQARPGNRACSTTAANRSCVLRDLVAGREYTFTVKAVSADVDGDPSDPSAPLTIIGPPGAPTGVKAVPGDGQVTVRFGPPLRDGGAPVTGYKVSLGNGPWQDATSPYTFTGLTNGAQVGVRVAASNSAGIGRAAEVQSTPFGVPDAPTGLTITRVSGTKVKVSMNASAPNGSPVSRYTVVASTGGRSCSAVKPSCTVTGLAPGTYTFTATARNAAGVGAPSAPSGEITLP